MYVKKLMKPAKKNWFCIAQDFNRVLSILSYFIFNRISIYFLLIHFSVVLGLDIYKRNILDVVKSHREWHILPEVSSSAICIKSDLIGCN